MIIVNNIPKDCTQCTFTNSCVSYYGGTMCKHEKEINKNYLERFWQKFGNKSTVKK